MTRYSIDLDSELDQLGAEATARLSSVTGSAKATGAEVVEEMFREMVRRFGGGYHPDTPSDGYVSYPAGYDPELISAVEDTALEYDLDLYTLAGSV